MKIYALNIKEAKKLMYENGFEMHEARIDSRSKDVEKAIKAMLKNNIQPAIGMKIAIDGFDRSALTNYERAYQIVNIEFSINDLQTDYVLLVEFEPESIIA